MIQFKDALKALITPELVSKAARVVGENDANISKAISAMIPSFLGVMLKKGDSPQIRNILHEAGNLNILLDLDSICQERPTKEQQKIGDDFLQHLLGDKAAQFSNPIAENAGISKVATNRLVSMVAPIVAGYLGNKLVKENRSMTNLLEEIDREKNGFVREIPAGIIEAFGLSSVLKTETKNAYATSNFAETKKSGGMGWLTWLIVILLLILLFFWWRSCRNEPVATVYERETIVRPDTMGQRAVTPAVTTYTANETTNAARATEELSLPDGTRISVYDDGVEEEMLDFLRSDDYRNATDNDLRDKWFTFDNIRFEFNSTTELMSESNRQLDNIAAILKSYPNARIKIAGFADRRGTEEANMQVSRERAKTIESMLERRGVGSQIARTEGYGDEYAQHSANASDRQRSEDRDIALRFVK